MTALRLPGGATLVLVADAPAVGPARVVAVVAEVLRALPPGSVLVIDRDRPAARGGSSDRARLERLRDLRVLTRERGSLLVVTGRPDLAAAAGADGVQLPEEGLDPRLVRRSFPGLLVGRSCHDLEGVLAAGAAGADWVTLAPVFPPVSKAAAGAALGLGSLRDIAARSQVPVVALGGVTSESAAPLREAGCAAAGVLGAVLLAPDPAAAAERVLLAFGGPVPTFDPS